jgi:hypothetical protein
MWLLTSEAVPVPVDVGVGVCDGKGYRFGEEARCGMGLDASEKDAVLV